MKQRFAIVSDSFGWHGRQLQKALRRRDYDAQFVPLQDCRFDLDGHGPGLVLPGFESTLPAGVFVRGIPGGSFEEVTFRLDILHALRESAIPVYNDARGIERTVDKAMTSFLLRQAGIATPPSWVCNSPEFAFKRVQRELEAGHELVCKPLFGSQGKGLKRINDAAQLDGLDDVNGVYYLQRFIKTADDYYIDWRVFVIGKRVVAAMQRKSSHWVTNVAQGAECFSALPGEILSSLALQAVETLDLDYAGVDIIQGWDGQYYVIEVNSIPAWHGLQSVYSGNVSDLLAQHFLHICLDQRYQGMVG